MIKKLLRIFFPMWFSKETVVSVTGVSSTPQQKSVVKAVSAAKKDLKKRGRPKKVKS